MALKDRLRDKPVLHTAVLVHDRYTKLASGQLAAAIAFFGFLSLFPLLLVALSIAGFLLAADPTRQNELAGELIGAIPGLGTEAMLAAIATVIKNRAATGLVGLAGLVWAGMRVVDSASVATTHILGGELGEEKFIRAKARALIVLITLGAVALVGVAAGGIAGWDVGGGLPQVLVTAGGLIVSFVLDVVLFLVAYRLLAARPGPPWRVVFPGAVLAAVGWTALKLVGSTYVESSIASAGAAYGSIAWVVAAMLLLYLAARLYAYGAVFNAVRRDQRGDDGDVRRDEAKGAVIDVRDDAVRPPTVDAATAAPVVVGPADHAPAGSLRVSLRPALAFLLTGGALAAVYRFLK